MADTTPSSTNSPSAMGTLRENASVGDPTTVSENDVLVSWKAKEYQPITLDQSQLLLGGLLGLVLLVFSLATANFLFTIVLVLLSVAIYLFLRREPRTLDVAVTTKGIVYGDRFFAYEGDLRLFWILYEPPLSVLKLSQTGFTTPTLEIQLEDQDPIAVRNALLPYLPEDTDAEEHSADRFSRRIGF